MGCSCRGIPQCVNAVHIPFLYDSMPLIWHQVRAASRPADVAAAVLELEACLRRSLLAPDWDAPPVGALGAACPSPADLPQLHCSAYTVAPLVPKNGTLAFAYHSPSS